MDSKLFCSVEMDLHGMKRKDLQTLCKKHGIPANLKNIEMANRLASLFKKETEETGTETKISPEDSVEADGTEDNLVVSKESKKVTFSPENEVFEFTRSVKIRKRKNVRPRRQVAAQDPQQGGIELRRSKRNVVRGITVAGSNEDELNTRRGIAETEKECSWPDVKVPRRSKRIGCSGITQDNCKVTELIDLEQFVDKDIPKVTELIDLEQFEDKEFDNQDGFKLEKLRRRSTRLTCNLVKSCVGETLLPTKQSKRLVDAENKGDELAKNNMKEVAMDFQVQETGKYHSKDAQDDHKVENVILVNNIDVHTDTQDHRRSLRFKVSAANPSMGAGTSNGRPLCLAKLSKEKRKTKQSKGSGAVTSQEGELVKYNKMEPLTDCEVHKSETNRRLKARGVYKVEMVPQRSKRIGNNVNVLMGKRPLVVENVEAVERDDLELENAPTPSMQLERNASEVHVDDQAEKGDKPPKRTYGNGCENTTPLRRSKRTAIDNMLDQAVNNSPKRCSVIHYERHQASVDTVKKLNVDDEMRHDSSKTPVVVEGSLVEKQTDVTLDSLVKSSEKAARRMKRDRSAEPRVDIETASTQSNLRPKKDLHAQAQIGQEKASGCNLEARGSSKKSKTMNQECVKDKLLRTVEDLPSSSETKAAEVLMIAENVLDSTLGISVDSSQKANTEELNSKFVEGKCEEMLELDTYLMVVVEEDKEEVRLAVSNPEAEQVTPAGHILVKEDINTKEHNSVAKLEDIEVTKILESSSKFWEQIHLNKDVGLRSLEKEVQAADVHGNSDYNSENNGTEDEIEIIKTGCNLEARGSSKKSKTMNQECVKDKLQGTVDDLPSSSETEAAEFLMIAENVLDSTPGISVDSSQTENTQELCSEVVEGKCEEFLELDTVLMAVVEEDKEEVRLAVSNLEAEEVSPTGHILVMDIASTVVTEEDINTEEHNSVAKLADVEVTEILENSSKCWEQIHSNKDDEIRSLNKEVLAAYAHGNFSEYNYESNGAEEEMKICNTGCTSVAHCLNLTPEKLLDEYAELKPEDAGCSDLEARSTCNKKFEIYKPRGMAAASYSISETKVTELVMISENFLDSTVKDSGDISPRRNTQELNSELTEGEHEENHGPDTISTTASKNDKEEASSPSEFLVKRSEVSNSDSEQGVPTDHIVVKDISPTVIAEEDIETIFISKTDLKEHSSVAKLAEAEEMQENSAECRNEIHSSKNVEEVSLENEIQAANLHVNFSEYNTEINIAEEHSEISKVSCITVGQCIHLKTLDEVKDDTLEKPNQTILGERGCKLNALELSGWSLTDFAREVNVSECLVKDEKKALSQPILVNKTTSSALDESTLFTTPERNLMLTEVVNENGTMFATDLATHHNEEAIKSQYVVSVTPEQFLDVAGKEEEHTAADFLDESDLLDNTDRCSVLGGSSQHVSREKGDSIVVELHDVSDISTRTVRQFSMGDFKGDEIGRNEVNGSVELHCKSGTSSSPAIRAHLVNSVSDGAETCGGTSLDESVVFTTPERNLMFMELVNENGTMRATISVTHHNDAAVESRYAVSTSPEQFLDEAGKEEEHTAADFLDESDLLYNTSRCLVLGGSSQHVSNNEGDSIVVELHDASDISTSPVRQFSMGDFKGDEIKTNEENGIVEPHCESETSISPARRAHLGNSVSDGAENSGGNKAMEGYDLFESSGQLTFGNSEQKEAVKSGEKVIAESHAESALPNILEDFELDEAAKSEENKAVELLVESDVFTIAENQLLLETDQGMKGDNVTAKPQDVSDVFTAAESHSLIRDSESDVAEKGVRENKVVELLGESNISTNSKRHILSGTRKMKENALATSEESFLFAFSKTRQLSGNFEQHNDGKQEPKEVEFKDESAFFSRPNNVKSDLSQYQSHHTPSPKVMSKDDSVVLGSHVASLDLSENTIVDSNGRIASKLSSSNEFHAEQDTAGAQFNKKNSQEESSVRLDAIQETSKQIKLHSPQVDWANLFDMDIEKSETILKAERIFPFSSYVLALRAEGDSETIGETSRYLEVAGTCSMVSEEDGPSTDIQNKINDAMEELAITDNDEAKETKSSEKSYEANLLLNSLVGSYVSGKACVLAGTEDEQLVSEVNVQITCEKNGEDEATGPIATVYAADVERETTPNPEETLNDSSENKEYLKIDETCKLSETQVRREPILIYRTQVRPGRNDDMKENALNSKIFQNLNVTSPRTAKRQPLKDLNN